MKQLTYFKMFVVAFVVLCFASASAQTANNQTNGSVQGKESFNTVRTGQNYQQQNAAHKPQPVPLDKRVPLNQGQKAAPAAAAGNSTVAFPAPVKQATSMDQLRLQRKQAADKGLPTTQYDNAIKEVNTNQAK